MLTDIYEYTYSTVSDREYGKDPFYSIVGIGESYESFKNTFISPSNTSTEITEDSFEIPLSEEEYTFQSIKEFLKSN